MTEPDVVPQGPHPGEHPDIEPGHMRSVRHETTSRMLDRESLLEDPIEQFARWYGEAVEGGGVPYPNAVQLATASADGLPSVRTVLIRDVIEGEFVFFTNYLSRKGRELAENPNAAICFLWQALERQVLVRGRVEKLNAAESDKYFHHRPWGSQIGALASRQSDPVENTEALEAAAAHFAREHPEGTVVPRPPHWGGYRLIPREIEFWQGRPDRLHDRFQYVLLSNGSWQISQLQP